MNKLIQWSLPLLLSIVVASAPAAPAPSRAGGTEANVGALSRKQVAADANWLIYINVKQFNASKFGSLLQSDRAPAEMREPLAQSQDLLGFNPLKDMDHMTLYGRTEDPQSGVALFTGRFDSEKVLARVRQRQGVSESRAGNRTIYQWTEPRKSQTLSLCLLQAGQLLITGSPQTMGQALEVLDGKRPHLVPGSALSVPENARGFLLATATGDAVKMGPLGNSKGFNTTLGESAEGLVEARFNILAEDEQMAASTLQVLQGLVLSALLTAKQNPELAELAQNAQVSAQGSTVTLQVQQSAEKLFDLLSQQISKRMRAPAQMESSTPPSTAPSSK
jgi:hypothetical protein